MSENKKIELNVSGMTCPSCANHVSDALNSVEGVEEVNVPGWQANKAIVTVNAGVVLTIEAGAYINEDSPKPLESGAAQRSCGAFNSALGWIIIGPHRAFHS